MEEISSLDSFHTEGADSSARPESETPKAEEETSQASAAAAAAAVKGDQDHVEEETPDNTPAESAAAEGGDGVRDAFDALKNDDGNKDDEGDGEDFEQISDGSFEVDENSRATSAGPPIDDDTTQDGIGEDEPPTTSEKTKTAATADESADFEEVEANISANASGVVGDEADMLGESDMTLPIDAATPDKSASGMDVDNEEEEANKSMDVVEGEEEDEGFDTTKTSKSKKVVDTAAQEEGEEDEGTSANKEKETEEEDADKEDADKEDADREDVDREDADREDVDREDADKEDADKDVGDHAEDEEAEHEDEPVENVQEPEESDVCLIPDDTENEMTDAEKEQAILARENAEKDADAEEQAEKDKEEASDEGEAATEGGTKDAEAQANQAGAEAAAAAGCKETAPVADADLPDPDEPLLEEMQSSTGNETGAAAKIIIGWIVSATHACQQCGEEKLCGFRYKNPDSLDLEYVCEQTCCDAILIANPGKYFIRRKKFLVEELTSDAAAVGDGSKTSAEGGDEATSTEAETDAVAVEDGGEKEAAVDTPQHYCLQCKETKTCKYFFKQDDESFYICNDDCFNLLSAEEPDKFKLKRHSIRVRNIGATTISALTDVVAAKKTTTGSSTGGAAESRVVARTSTEAEAARLERVASFTRRCADCFAEITLGDKNLLWETMDFCNEICLGKYQRTIGASCQTCAGEVPHQALGKYCVRFGFDIRQFCCAACLNEFKKGLKTCSCCQKDISGGNEGFLAPVGDKEQFKDFCSQTCMRRYDTMCNPKKKQRNDLCAVCNNDKQVRVEILLDEKEHTFCSNPCFSAFKFVSNIVADQCGMCCKYFERKGSEAFTIYTERRAKVYCSRICLNVYIIVNRRIVSCQWCKVKKYNFDMIYKQQDAQEILMCSLNCLTLYGVSINAFSRTVAKCDNCNNSATPQYHLTMSDASMRNFCTYQCVMQFQSQFARAPLTLESEVPPQQSSATATSTTAEGSASPATLAGSGGKNTAPFPTGLPKRVKLKVPQPSVQKLKLSLKNSVASNKKQSPGPMPVISTVSSLASGETMFGSVTVRRGRGRGRKMDTPPLLPSIPTTTASASTTGSGRGRPRKVINYERSPSPVSLSPPRSSSSKRPAATTGIANENFVDKIATKTETKIVTVPPFPTTMRNVQTSCQPATESVAVQCERHTSTIETQTDKDYSNKTIIPVPVPIYIPQPMYMYSAPFPVPVPCPLPIPVPIFIPTTRNSAQGILKEIKKIQDKMPTDPFEAELLMMAEMVAEEKRVSDSDSDCEVKPDVAIVSMQYSNNVQQHHHQQQQQQHQQQQQVEVANNSYGEDVLQMALKMATGEYDQPTTVDLDASSMGNNPTPGIVGHDDYMQQQHHSMMDQRCLNKNSVASNKKQPSTPGPMPVISTVSSLASGETMIGSVTVRRSRGRGRKLETPPPLLLPPSSTAVASTNTAGLGRGRPRKIVNYERSPSPVSMSPTRMISKRAATGTENIVEKVVKEIETKIIAVPPFPPAVRNVQTSCQPQTVTVGFQCTIRTVDKATQTDKDYSNKILLPVPVPVYVPQPMYMYSAPFPVPVPIPLPIPVPIFVPTTRNSAQGIMKEMKKIQEKMPTDPFEAELLMMAEMVAEDKHVSDSDSDDEKPDVAIVSMQYGGNNNVQQQQQQQQQQHQQQQQVEATNNSYGEDVLQMALKMATGEYDQPTTVDLESAMTANTITNPPPGMVGHDDSMSHMSGHHMQQQHGMMDQQRGGRGRKRGSMVQQPASPRNNRSPVKRQRLQDIETSPQPTPQQALQPVEKPDANMCLKYTFGVNAWKQWVMTKNADIEKSSVRRRTFKTELLQMTADELNFSLCLFVKEVRKPNGTEYAPDTIYYLVLGIQQYLYENGRIDNIFTDPYYESFTDCLDEVARKFSVLYNDSQYIVTRVEEEHLWECKQLGAHSPHVLLSTLMFFNTKHFNLTTVEEHMQLSFSHIMKHWKRSAQNAKTAGTRNVLLRFYPPQAGLDANPRKKKVYEQQENEENPLRCPVRLYEFYLSKCPESVKTRNDVFYLQPERSCVPDSPVWYSTQALSQDSLQKMLHRVKMVKEINIALLTS